MTIGPPVVAAVAVVAVVAVAATGVEVVAVVRELWAVSTGRSAEQIASEMRGLRCQV